MASFDTPNVLCAQEMRELQQEDQPPPQLAQPPLSIHVDFGCLQRLNGIATTSAMQQLAADSKS
jgi:hypothetical protein